MKIRRNDPCPCGSGKKYKHCCMRTSRVTGGNKALSSYSAHEVRNLPVTQFLRELDPLETLIWLSATAAYPCNAAFLTRISLAMSLLLAAKGVGGNRKPQNGDIEQLFGLLETAFGDHLRVVEDFVPFDIRFVAQ